MTRAQEKLELRQQVEEQQERIMELEIELHEASAEPFGFTATTTTTMMMMAAAAATTAMVTAVLKMGDDEGDSV